MVGQECEETNNIGWSPKDQKGGIQEKTKSPNIETVSTPRKQEGKQHEAINGCCF